MSKGSTRRPTKDRKDFERRWDQIKWPNKTKKKKGEK